VVALAREHTEGTPCYCKALCFVRFSGCRSIRLLVAYRSVIGCTPAHPQSSRGASGVSRSGVAITCGAASDSRGFSSSITTDWQGTAWQGPDKPPAPNTARNPQKKTPRAASTGRSKKFLKPQDCRAYEPLTAAATSAAKSSSFFSMPSPTSRRTKPRTSAPASAAAFSTVRSGFTTNA